MNKKVKKLFRDPKIFFKDMYLKRSIQLKKHIPIKRNGNHIFTVVSAVYNVEKYLNDYFDSLTTQSLDFKKHIRVILVDDGSTDTSAQIIQKWQKKYPKNIRYIYKENGGQASARNLGLKYVETDWVVFTDPDDYLHPDYFKSVDYLLYKTPSAMMLVTNIKLFLENQNITKDSHPLKFRFDKTKNLKISALDKFINLSVASTFFKNKHIKDKGLLFDDKLKPNFEDGKFIADYLLDLQDSDAIFSREAVYFYRKREDSSSTLDTSWKKREKFSNVFELGFIPMLQAYKDKLGYVPASIQKTALYDMSWYIQYLLNRPEKISFLSANEKEQFSNLVHTVFSFIDEKNIMEFGLAGTWLFHKIGMLGAFKNAEPPFQIAYIENIDREKKQFLISYFTYFDLPYSIQVNHTEIIPAYQKTVVNNFNNKLFTYEKRLWIPYDDITDSDKISVLLNQKQMRVSIRGKVFTKGITLKELLALFQPSEKYASDGSWLLMDRETKADDNAEHLYRYMMNNHPEQSCYFALNNDAPDWQRLKQEGFNLIEFGSQEFEERLRKANKIISSHLEQHINNYFNDLYEFSKKFIFLQHGITIHDLSTWTNSKINLQCFITATKPEFLSINSDFNSYKLTPKEVVLTGFPRYDSLISKNISESKKILIMPTWRSNIVGQHTGRGSNTRTMNENFMKTEYAQAWYTFLHSNELKKLADQYQYEIIFAPHPNIEPYLEVLDVPNYINIWSSLNETESIQNLFGRSSILITDYSSVSFDMAYLNKAIIYYQFDKENFYSGIHTTQKGYFSYETDGFGPIAITENQTLIELELILKNGGANQKYLQRIHETFPFQNGGNCDRVYQAIINLDKPDFVDPLPFLKNSIIQAEEHKIWELVASRIACLLKNSTTLNTQDLADYEERYLHALFESNQFKTLLDYLNQNKPLSSEYWAAKINLQIGDKISGAYFFANTQDNTTLEEDLVALLAASYARNLKITEMLHKKVQSKISKSEYENLLSLSDKIKNLEYFSALELIETCLEIFGSDDKKVLKFELLAAYINMNLNDLQAAHNYLVRYEQYHKNDPACRIAIARLAKLRRDNKKLFNQLNRVFKDSLFLIPEDLVTDYLQEISLQGNQVAEEHLLEQFLNQYPNNENIVLYKAEKLYLKHKWQELVELLGSYESKSHRSAYLYILACSHIQLSTEMQATFNSIIPEDSFSYWKMAAEIAQLNNDTILLRQCLINQMNHIN